MSFDRRYLLWSLAYVVAGMALGIFMAASNDFGQHATHAHMLLVGFGVSLAYGVIHKLWVGHRLEHLAKIQFVMHQAGAAVMSAGLLMIYGKVLPETQLAPVLAVASMAVLLGALLMLFMVLRAKAVRTQSRAQSG